MLCRSVHPPHDDIPGRRIGRRVASMAWDKLTNEIFGHGPVAARIAVRVQLNKNAVEAFGRCDLRFFFFRFFFLIALFEILI